MTNTLNVHARKISSLTLNGLIALFFIVSGCNPEAPEGQLQSENRSRAATPAPVSVTSVPVSDKSTTPSVVPEKAVLEVKEEAPKVVTYAEAESAFNQKDYDAAVDLFTRYTNQKTSNPWGYYMLGLSSYRSGDLESAKTAYQKTLELDPGHFKSWINLSRAYLAGGETREAIEALDKALAIDPESTDVYRLQGRAFHNLGQHSEAIASYKQAIILNENDAWSMNNLALVYIEEQQFDLALPVLALTVEINDKEALFFNNLGMVLEHHDQVNLAINAYTKATEIDANNQKAMDNLARISEVREKINLEALDLSELADSFRAMVSEWQAFEVQDDTDDLSSEYKQGNAEQTEGIYFDEDGC